MAINNQFLVSVGEVILRDPTTMEALLYGTTNIDSALTMSMTGTEVHGGINNPLLYTYFHDRKVDVKITSATFNNTILALNAGTSVLNSNVTVVGTDCLVLNSGSGTLAHTPTGNVSVFLPNGTVSTVTPIGNTIYLGGGGNQKVDAVYEYTASIDRVTIETTKPPSVTDLTIIAEVRDNTNTLVYYLQINIPRFQLSGNYNLSLTADGVSNQALEGTSLGTRSSDCSTGDYYARVSWIPAATTSVAVSDITLLPATWSLSAATVPATKQLSVWGLRGGLYSNVNLTTSASYNVVSGSTGAAAYFNVGQNTGLITAGSGVAAGWLATIKATYIDPVSSACLVDYHDIITSA